MRLGRRVTSDSFRAAQLTQHRGPGRPDRRLGECSTQIGDRGLGCAAAQRRRGGPAQRRHRVRFSGGFTQQQLRGHLLRFRALSAQ